MENEEIDTALEELETRLERLRALYEQYFMGIEKLEPQIPRKDVDRRIYVLRREKIRNTGKRFKLQTLISRYNTFAQYWQRICREIENGTYKRHLLRAEKNFGPAQLLTVAARRRFGRQHAVRDSQQPAAPQAEAPAPADLAPPSPPTAPSADASTQTPLRPRSRTPTWPGLPTPPPPSGAAPPPPFNAQAVPPVRVPAGIQPSADAQRLAASALPSAPAVRPAPSSSPRKSSPFESLELDMDFMGDWDPNAAKRRSTVGSPAAASARAAGGAIAPTAEPRRLAPPPKPRRDPVLASPRAAAPSVPPPQPAPERRPPVQRPVTERPPAPRPASENPAAAAAARARNARPRTAPAEANVTDGKLRELHQRLAEVSKSAGQPTVSFDGLSKSLRAAEAKLRAKHGNRRIDFEVVLKDGKPVVKPVVR